MTDTTSLRELPAKWQADAFAVVAAYGPGSDYGQALQMCIDDLNAALSARDEAGAWTVDRLTVEVEKRLCAILGRKWSAAGISIESLLAEVARRLAARAEPQAGEWVLVPREPTQAMLDANGESAFPAGKEWLERDARSTWAAMLAAAPTPPATAGEE